MAKKYLILLSFTVTVITASLLFWGPFGDKNINESSFDVDALVNGDKLDSQATVGIPKRPFKTIKPSSGPSDFDASDAQAIMAKITDAAIGNTRDILPSLDDEKKADLVKLKSKFGSITDSDIKYDHSGRVRSIYDSITTTSFDHNDSVAVGSAIQAIGENHKALFGLGSQGAITRTKVTCANDICATKLQKSFYGVPAWDHEQTVSTKQDTIFAITGVFYEPRLPAPRAYVPDEDSFRTAIARHFSVGAGTVMLDQPAELGIARLGGMDYYAFRLPGVSVGGSPYDVFIDAESGNVANALTLVYESAVSASGTALDGSSVSFQANQSGSSYQMIDSRFPLGYATYFFNMTPDDPVLIESSSASSGWPDSAVSALAFTKKTIDYFKDNHDYDAVNPEGSNLLMGVNLSKATAFFNKYNNSIVFGTGEGFTAKSGLSFAASKDVVAHEVTHGVIFGSSNIAYEFQSGALNESFSDFFGSMVDGDDWTMGEDLLSPLWKYTRNMANPADAYNPQPSHFSEYRSLPKSQDSGGVHKYSGIPNRALYLLAEGLSSENLGSSVGRTKAANLAFKTMIGLTPKASFNEAAEYMTNLAKVEYEAESEVYDATVLAWKSVGLPHDTTTSSAVSNTEVPAKDVTGVAYLKPYYSTSSVTPANNKYTINVQFFLNSNPEFNAEDNYSIPTDYYSRFSRPLLINETSDGYPSVIYKSDVGGSFYLFDGATFEETLIDDSGVIAGLDYSYDNKMAAYSVVDTNLIVTSTPSDGGEDDVVIHEIVLPTTGENASGQPVTYIDEVRFDPTGRFVVFDFFLCALGETDCYALQNGNWSIGVLDVTSGLLEFPYPNQPARFDLGFPAFSNLTDRYITLDVVETTEDSGVTSAVYIYDRRTGETTGIVGVDRTTEKLGAYGYPSFSADDTSIVFSARFDDYQGMYSVLLDDYKAKDVDNPVSLLNPTVSFKAFASGLPSASNVPALSLNSSSFDFGDVIRSGDGSQQLCLENKGGFPIDVYDSIMPAGFRWDGDNQMISEGQSVCSPVIVSSTTLELGAFSTTFAITHNGANSPTPITVAGIVAIDTDLDGIANYEDTDDDDDGVADGDDAFPLDATESIDTDGDGTGDNADTDDDGDNVADTLDAFPLDATESADTDSDGTGNNADTDDDGDGVDDSADAFPLDATETVDSDNDGVGDNADAFPTNVLHNGDSDADGMPDSWESKYGLDSADTLNDADSDLDGDGISNLDEFRGVSDPTRDELPPELVIPEDITITAVGRLTPVDLGIATATDNKDGELTPVASNLGPFASGLYEIIWSISDAAGNVSQDSQMLTVLPLLNLTLSSFVVEDSTVIVAVALSGVAPAYPVTIPVTIGGSAGLGVDFTASAEQIVVTEGREGSLTIAILADAEYDAQETITITLGEPTNASLGAVSQRTLTILEGNVAPELAFSVAQAGGRTRIVYADGGVVTVSAVYSDLNSEDSHALTWDTSASVQTTGNSAEFTFVGDDASFDPAGLSDGTILITATVVDDGDTLLDATKTVAINILATAPILDVASDTDGDGINDAEEGYNDSDGDGIPDYQDNIPESYFAPASADSTRVMQASVGTKIILGNSALTAGANSVGISEDDLATIVGSSDDEYNYPSGLFDFAVSGAKAGDSYRLVLPLATTVPAGAVFRKFMGTNIGWQEYAVNATNSIATTFSAGGACPEPGSSLYADGLNSGDTCVELLIEDGGPNDTDGAADGTVTDPSGLAVPYFGPPSSSSTISFNATELEIGGSSTLTTTVTAVNADGRRLEGMTVTAIASIDDVSVGVFTDQGDGVYIATVKAGSTTGDVTITAVINDGYASREIISSSIKLKQPVAQVAPVTSGSGGGGCTVGVNSSPDASLVLLMLLGLLVAIRRKLVGLQTVLAD